MAIEFSMQAFSLQPAKLAAPNTSPGLPPIHNTRPRNGNSFSEHDALLKPLTVRWLFFRHFSSLQAHCFLFRVFLCAWVSFLFCFFFLQYLFFCSFVHLFCFVFCSFVFNCSSLSFCSFVHLLLFFYSSFVHLVFLLFICSFVFFIVHLFIFFYCSPLSFCFVQGGVVSA